VAFLFNWNFTASEIRSHDQTLLFRRNWSWTPTKIQSSPKLYFPAVKLCFRLHNPTVHSLPENRAADENHSTHCATTQERKFIIVPHFSGHSSGISTNLIVKLCGGESNVARFGHSFQPSGATFPNFVFSQRIRIVLVPAKISLLWLGKAEMNYMAGISYSVFVDREDPALTRRNSIFVEAEYYSQEFSHILTSRCKLATHKLRQTAPTILSGGQWYRRVRCKTSKIKENGLWSPHGYNQVWDFFPA